MSDVVMTHPSLEGRRIEVPEVSVHHYQASGWQVADPQQEDTKAAAKGRRRTQKGEG